jgi:hypothetical protein
VRVLLIVRRAHLYLGLFLLPWFLMFGVSSLWLNHPAWRPAETALWKTVSERDYVIDVPATGDLRPSAAKMLSDLGYDTQTGFGVFRNAQRRVMVNIPNFRHPIRLTYFIDRQHVVVEERAFAWVATLTSMHTHDGYYLRAPGQTMWGVTIDLFCVALVFWIASGLYMWWALPGSRNWGWVTLVASVVSFVWMMAKL